MLKKKNSALASIRGCTDFIDITSPTCNDYFLFGRVNPAEMSKMSKMSDKKVSNI